MVDYKSIKTIEQQDKELEELWAEFYDVPIDPDKGTIEDDFLDFPHGTHRETVWKWFDQRYSKGVYHLLYQTGGEDSTMEIAELYHRRSLCCECMSEVCAFNSNGICMAPFITGAAPRVNDDGCEDCVWRNDY